MGTIKPRLIQMACGNNEYYALLFYAKKDSDFAYVDIYDMVTKELHSTLKTPFPQDGIDRVRYVQSFDVIYFAQGDTYPCKLTRNKADDGDGYTFAFETANIRAEPLMDWDINSKHEIAFFALPDEDLLQTKDGEKFYPKGSVRSAGAILTFNTKNFTAVFSAELGLTMPTTSVLGDSGQSLLSVFKSDNFAVSYGFAVGLDQSKEIVGGVSVSFSRPIVMKVNVQDNFTDAIGRTFVVYSETEGSDDDGTTTTIWRTKIESGTLYTYTKSLAFIEIASFKRDTNYLLS